MRRAVIANLVGFTAALVAGIVLPAAATAEATPIGRWQVISDRTNEPVAVMKIFEHEGEYRGLIDQLLTRTAREGGLLCDKCPGSLKGQPIEGLVVMQGLKRSGEEFTGGHVLDPESGGYYNVKMNLAPDGDTLRVRGYMGISLLGRTQTWYRIE